jgi:hypothetical protein
MDKIRSTVQALGRRTYIHTHIHTGVQRDGLRKTVFSYLGELSICKSVKVQRSIFSNIKILSHVFYVYGKLKFMVDNVTEIRMKQLRHTTQ